MWLDKQKKSIKILFLIPIWGWLTSAIYRIIRYKTSKNALTLFIGIICLFPFIGIILSICDIITIVINDEIKVLAE